MVAVGVLYLAFEKILLAKYKMAGDSTAPADNLLSRSLIGAQVSKNRIHWPRLRILIFRIDWIDCPIHACY